MWAGWLVGLGVEDGAGAGCKGVVETLIGAEHVSAVVEAECFHCGAGFDAVEGVADVGGSDGRRGADEILIHVRMRPCCC